MNAPNPNEPVVHLPWPQWQALMQRLDALEARERAREEVNEARDDLIAEIASLLSRQYIDDLGRGAAELDRKAVRWLALRTGAVPPAAPTPPPSASAAPSAEVMRAVQIEILATANKLDSDYLRQAAFRRGEPKPSASGAPSAAPSAEVLAEVREAIKRAIGDYRTLFYSRDTLDVLEHVLRLLDGGGA